MRQLLRVGAFALFACLVLAVPAFGRDLTDAEKAGLADTVASFDAAMRANDMETVLGTLPPKMLTAMAEQFGISVDELKIAAAEQSKLAMESVTLVSFSMDVANAKHDELADGTNYALIATEAVMDAGSGKIRAVSETLAILDGGQWYLLRVDAGQLPLLHQVYPGLVDVQISPGTMEPVE